MALPRRQRSTTAMIGCGCFALILLCSGLGTAAFLFGTGIMRNSEPYQVAFQRAVQDPDVQQALGTPIKQGWLPSGSVSVSGTHGNAELAIPLHGPKGKGTVYVTAHKEIGRWMFDRMVFTADGASSSDDIDLLSRDAEEGGPDSPKVEHL